MAEKDMILCYKKIYILDEDRKSQLYNFLKMILQFCLDVIIFYFIFYCFK